MYQHHKDSLENLIHYYRNIFDDRESVVAIVFGGSVAKGIERIDSDLDAMVILTPECYERRAKENRLSECVTGYCTYEEGYFDVKFMNKVFLKEAAECGSEPTRNSFICSRVVYSTDPEIEEIVPKIPHFQKGEVAEKMHSFFSALHYDYGYFWKDCKPEGFMRLRTASNILYDLYRMILQENEILFPCNRRLEESVEKAAKKPENFMALAKKFEETLADDDCDAVVNAYLEWTIYPHITDGSKIMTRYQEDMEQWWRKLRPQFYEW